MGSAVSRGDFAPIHNCLQFQLGPEQGACKDPIVFQMIIFILIHKASVDPPAQNLSKEFW